MLSRRLAAQAPAWLAAAGARGAAGKAGAVAKVQPADDGITTTTHGQAFVGDLRSTSALEVRARRLGLLATRLLERYCPRYHSCAALAPLRIHVMVPAGCRRWATMCSTTPRSGCRCAGQYRKSCCLWKSCRRQPLGPLTMLHLLPAAVHCGVLVLRHAHAVPRCAASPHAPTACPPGLPAATAGQPQEPH